MSGCGLGGFCRVEGIDRKRQVRGERGPGLKPVSRRGWFQEPEAPCSLRKNKGKDNYGDSGFARMTALGSSARKPTHRKVRDEMGHPAEAPTRPPEIQGGTLFESGFTGEVVGDGDGDELGGEATVGEAGPALQLVFAAQAKVGVEQEVDANASRVEGVGEVGLAIGIVEVAAADHGFEIRDIREEILVSAEVASADLIGPLVALVSGCAIDLVDLGFEAEVGPKIEVGVCGAAAEGLRGVVRFGVVVSDADLEVTGARGDWRSQGTRMDAPPRSKASANPGSNSPSRGGSRAEGKNAQTHGVSAGMRGPLPFDKPRVRIENSGGPIVSGKMP